MKQTLQLKISQQLTMTPQLQQAIRLLQLSNLDLQQEIQQMIEGNPMLELPDDHDDLPAHSDVETAEFERPAEFAAEMESFEMLDRDNIPSDLPVDTQWDDIYQSGSVGGQEGNADNADLDSRNAAQESLQDHLRWQLNLTPMSDTDRVIALALIDAVEPGGLLGVSIEDLHGSLQPSLDVELEEVLAVLHRIQLFDPVGVAAQDLRECLLIQMRQLPDDTPWLEQARALVGRFLPQLGNRDYPFLMRRLALKEPELMQVITLIRSLDPHPGSRIAPATTEYIIPDVFVKKVEGRWVVELNPEIAPRLRINTTYAEMVKRADSGAVNTYLKDNLQEARWFLKSLHSRNETLMKVAARIVEHQQGFLEYGEEAMKPLILHDIANAVEMHESTISRVTTNKYMHTPAGVYELKYFFSSHVSTDSGGECSSTAIRAIIKKLVASESPRKPLSDNKITQILKEQGVDVARRTIAKYRESLGIPPSHERKRLV